MIVGRVIGNIVSSRKEDNIIGYKLLIVQPLDSYNLGKNIVAIDRVGAGVDSDVIVTIGSSARLGLTKDIPVDAAIIGIID